jgi:hypothetical protein
VTIVRRLRPGLLRLSFASAPFLSFADVYSRLVTTSTSRLQGQRGTNHQCSMCILPWDMSFRLDSPILKHDPKNRASHSNTIRNAHLLELGLQLETYNYHGQLALWNARSLVLKDWICLNHDEIYYLRCFDSRVGVSDCIPTDLGYSTLIPRVSTSARREY